MPGERVAILILGGRDVHNDVALKLCSPPGQWNFRAQWPHYLTVARGFRLYAESSHGTVGEADDKPRVELPVTSRVSNNNM